MTDHIPTARSVLMELADTDYSSVAQNARAADTIIKELADAGYVIVKKEPTEAMLNAARDWSANKYGKPVGNDDATGCYRSMIAAST